MGGQESICWGAHYASHIIPDRLSRAHQLALAPKYSHTNDSFAFCSPASARYSWTFYAAALPKSMTQATGSGNRCPIRPSSTNHSFSYSVLMGRILPILGLIRVQPLTCCARVDAKMEFLHVTRGGNTDKQNPLRLRKLKYITRRVGNLLQYPGKWALRINLQTSFPSED